MEGSEPRHWSRILLALLLAAAVGEAGCRLVIRQIVGSPFTSFDPYSFSGYGLYRQNHLYTHPHFVHNSAGFRNVREFAIDKPSGVFRVLCIGASVLYAGSAPIHTGTSERIHTEETISAYLVPHLERMPELAGLDVEVINASVNRHFIRHTLAYYVAELAPYDPDLVLIFGTHNDSARLGLSHGMSTLIYDRAAPSPEETRLELLANEASLAALMEKTVRVAVNSSALAATAYRVLDRVLKRISVRLRIARTAGPPLVGELATREQMERNVRYYLAALDALLTYIETQGSRPVVFWEYLLLAVDDVKPLSAHERQVRDFINHKTGGLSAEHARRLYEVRDRIAGHLESRQVPMIDILEDLRSYPHDLYNDYLHYNAAGNRWVAGIIARELRPIVAEIVEPR